MQAIRHLLAQRHFAVLLCTVALLCKLLVPTGYMISDDRGAITLSICSGFASQTTMPGMEDGSMASMADHGSPKDHGKVEMPCAYAGLSAQSLGAVDPVMLVAALAIVVARALLATPRPTFRPAPFLRPPLRGPPLALK